MRFPIAPSVHFAAAIRQIIVRADGDDDKKAASQQF
jgi:hypothetical protein